MTPVLASIFMAAFAFAQMLSAAAHNLKGYSIRNRLIASVILALAVLMVLLLGDVLGNAFASNMPSLPIRPESALLIVLALKVFIKGWKTKPLQRVFDLTKPLTMAGFALALNMDLLLVAIALGFIPDHTLMTSLLIPLGAGIIGLITGNLVARKASMILPNLIDVVTAILLLFAGIYQWLA